MKPAARRWLAIAAPVMVGMAAVELTASSMRGVAAHRSMRGWPAR
ncbi:hypothetical protein [Acinetobacter baumannii]|nr:hypothetical protein [Acinetobacter baumannii]